MTTEPHVPDENEIITGTTASSDQVRRGIAKIKADALREAADDLNARANRPSLIGSADKWAGWYGGVRAAMQSEEAALRARADRIEEAINE